MRPLAALLITVLAFAALVRADSPRNYAELDRSRVFKGTVVLVEQRHLTLSVDDVRRKFSVSTDTMILLNGRQATLDDLAPGMVAVVTGERESNRVAKTIDANMSY